MDHSHTKRLTGKDNVLSEFVYQVIGNVDNKTSKNSPGTEWPLLSYEHGVNIIYECNTSRFFDNIKDVPTQAYTMGLSSIMSAEKIYLVAVGKHKKEILEEAVYGGITEDIPASLLQEHPNCEVYYSE